MDALEFLRERKRMCNLCKHCEGCPLERAGCGLGTSASDEEYEKIIAAVEQWSKEHPRADVAPVVHGRWISFLGGDHIMPERYYRCSRCGRVESRRQPYCHCGAKMDGGADNEAN